MPSTNGHAPKRAILYARVSTEEQAKSGYSLAQQIEALRTYAAREGYEVLEEVLDPGQSGASLERPGMDRIRDLVATSGVSVVLAQDRDRFAREPAYHYLLKKEFEEYGTKIRALSDQGDDSPEGELTDAILDQLGKFERAKTAERTRRGRLRKVREGKLIAGSTPNYGFEFNHTRDGYEVNEEAMSVVRRIFGMTGVEGKTLHEVCGTLRKEGVPTPGHRKLWSPTFIRNIINNDVYKPHTVEEVREVVAEGVASALDPDKRYGLWWYNKNRIRSKQTAKSGPDGRHYHRSKKTTRKPKDEWIAAPVPDAGVPREWVESARVAIRDNRKPSHNGRRFWELSGGIAWCGLCGARMETSSVKGRNGGRHFYYRCWRRQKFGADGCPHPSNYPARRVEPEVWEYVSGLLKDPERLRVGLDRMVDEERRGLRGDPEKEAGLWLDKLAEADRKRSSFQDMAAEGLITFDELRAKLASLDEIQQTARRELEALSRRRERVEELEHDRDALLAYYARMVPEDLDGLTSEQRHQVYKMLRLRVVLRPKEAPELSWAFNRGLEVSKNETTSRRRTP